MSTDPSRLKTRTRTGIGVLLAAYMLATPWYAPSAAKEPSFGPFPWWAALVLVGALAIAIATSWNYWAGDELFADKPSEENAEDETP